MYPNSLLVVVCKMFECCMTPMLFNVLVYIFKLFVVTTPVNEGSCRGALRFKALCVAVDIGRLAGVTFVTSPSPTMLAVIPLTVP